MKEENKNKNRYQKGTAVACEHMLRHGFHLSAVPCSWQSRDFKLRTKKLFGKHGTTGNSTLEVFALDDPLE